MNTANGAKASAATAVNGTYVLVVPAGTYEIAVATGAHEPWKKAVQVRRRAEPDPDVALKPGKLAAEVAVVATAESQVELRHVRDGDERQRSPDPERSRSRRVTS